MFSATSARGRRSAHPTIDGVQSATALSTQPGLDPRREAVALRLTVTPPGLGRSNLLVYAQEAMRAAKKPVLVWTPQTLFQRVLPSSLPPASGSNSEVLLSACAEQIQGASFCIYTPVDLSDVSVTVPQDLQGIGHVLPKSAIDVRVVKVWEQDGDGPLRNPDTAAAVPELLVKDDRVPLSGTDTDLRLTGPAAVCNITADTSKQFWLTVTVPRNTPPGPYSGRILVSGRGLPAPVAVRVAVTVPPLRLLSPAKQYGVDLRSRLDPAPAILPSPDDKHLVTDYVSKDVLDAQLADIDAHGFTIASLVRFPRHTGRRRHRVRALWPRHGIQSLQRRRRPAGSGKRAHGHQKPGLDLLCRPGAERGGVRPACLRWRKWAFRMRLTSRVQSDFTALGSSADIVVYNRDSEYPQQLLRTGGLRVSMTRDWWYWPATDEDPLTNRH